MFRAYLCARGEVRGWASVSVCGSHSQALEVAHVGLAAVHAAGRERGVQLRRTGDGEGTDLIAFVKPRRMMVSAWMSSYSIPWGKRAPLRAAFVALACFFAPASARASSLFASATRLTWRAR